MRIVPHRRIIKTLAQLLAEDPSLEYRLKRDGKWHRVTPAWAAGSVATEGDGLREVPPAPTAKDILGVEVEDVSAGD